MRYNKGSWVRKIAKRDLKRKAKLFISPLFRYLSGIQVENLVNLDTAEQQIDYLESTGVIVPAIQKFTLNRLKEFKEDTEHYRVFYYKICVYAEREEKEEY